MNLFELESLSQAWAAMLVGVVFRSFILVLACAFVVLLFRSRTAEIRHLIWRGALYGLLLLPILQLTVPPLRRVSLVLSRAETVLLTLPQTGARSQGRAYEMALHTAPQNSGQHFPWMLLACAAYICVTSVLLLRLSVSLIRLQKLVRRSEPIVDRDLQLLSHRIWLTSLSATKPQIRVSADVAVPMVIGFDDITILLPASWSLWTSDKLQAVLLHEMAHVPPGFRYRTPRVIGSMPFLAPSPRLLVA